MQFVSSCGKSKNLEVVCECRTHKQTMATFQPRGKIYLNGVTKTKLINFSKTSANSFTYPTLPCTHMVNEISFNELLCLVYEIRELRCVLEVLRLCERTPVCVGVSPHLQHMDVTRFHTVPHHLNRVPSQRVAPHL